MGGGEELSRSQPSEPVSYLVLLLVEGPYQAEVRDHSFIVSMGKNGDRINAGKRNVNVLTSGLTKRHPNAAAAAAATT